MREQPWHNIEAPKDIREQRDSFDARWFSRFEQVGNFQAYEYFEGDKVVREREKQAFLTREKENPNLDYPKLDVENIDRREVDLLALKEQILAEEENSVVRQVYRWRINEKLAECRLMRAAAAGDMRRFRRYAEFIYGGVSPEIAQYTINQVHEVAERGLSSEDDRVVTVAKELKQLIPSHRETIVEAPSEARQSFVAEVTREEFSDLVRIPTKGKGEKFSAEEMQGEFQRALRELAAQNWVAVISKRSSTTVNTSQEKREIDIPEGREVLSRKLKGLLVHEAGTHVKRRVNGERSKLKLLALGLDRYEGGEEGVARMREDVMKESLDEFAGESYYLLGTLAQGTLDTPRDFRGCFEILSKYLQLQHLLKGKMNVAEAEQKAQTTAWNACIRMFRGTDAKTPGVFFTKDLIYREGNIAVWETVTKSIPGTNTPEMFRWSVGKYDPSNNRHIWVLSELGITDEDLENLEK